MALDPLFDQHKCPVPYVPKVDFHFIDNCEILPTPEPVFDCPDVEIPPQIPQPPVLPPDIVIPDICIPCPDITVGGSLTFDCNSKALDIGVTPFGGSCTASPSCQFVFDFNFAIPALPCPRLTAAGTVSVAKEGEEPGVDVIVTPQQPSGSCAATCDYHLDFNFTVPVPSSMSVHLPSDSVRLLCPSFTTNTAFGFASTGQVAMAITGDDDCQFVVDFEVQFPCPQFSAGTSVHTGTDLTTDLQVTPLADCAFNFDLDFQVPCPTITAGDAVIDTGDEPSGDLLVTKDGDDCGAIVDIQLTVPPALGPPGLPGGMGDDGTDGRDGLNCIDYSCYGGYAACQLWIWCHCGGEDHWIKPNGHGWEIGDPPYPETAGRMYGEAKITCFCDCISSSSISSESLSSISSLSSGCCDCPAYRITVSGVTCSVFNREWVLTQGGFPNSPHICEWYQRIAGVEPITADLYYDGGDVYTLNFNDEALNSTAVYELAADAWDCHGCNTMNLVSVTGFCSGWPPTVEVCCDNDFTITCGGCNLPPVIYAHLTSNDCPALEGVQKLVYTDVSNLPPAAGNTSGWWNGGDFAGTSNSDFSILVICDPNTNTLKIRMFCGGSVPTLHDVTIQSCEPFQAVCTIDLAGSHCCNNVLSNFIDVLLNTQP